MTVPRRDADPATARTRGLPGDGLVAPPEWTRDALCAQVDPELFFPDKGGSTRQAKAVCRRCPVRAECLDYALAYESGEHGTRTSHHFGIYGGLSERERRRLRKERTA